ncbi:MULTISPECIES: energy-coupling factor transporter ATPase [Pelosinus]|uniref:ABC transporter ATP-binding protein n=1 Tax=Pelosinus fermentans B4 TaxID=1149862 RepID=I8RFN4_9FIRM|nr:MULTISPECIES: energy-coupling factor transporter ATPase [Pelosinus]EIW16520.1 cobalt ABC transporter, ATPase subunit [Pelosinus fermentans B4]EIW22499.1 cobalt ABC transporter, ATPase subunit [Pelosinus fermentans A11]OAM95827.1 cobalt ABC transporter, ATPase subunit [Pelosinus fermentans DSM 17108]SDR33259.1 energy-coupling factor transport system ATP-binding protein [Pelosinus fermentans]
MGEFITVKDMCHTYLAHEGEEVQALDHINIAIGKGEFVAIIGTNGSGKSTLAKHLNALLTPSSGQCLINGMDTKEQENLWEIRQTVGMVFQNPDNQIVATLVEEDVAFGPENLGVPPDEIRNRVTEALKDVGMEDYRQHGPHLLSGGQKQRVAIAGVLAMRSNCLVLDEPTAMLDPQGRQEVLSTVLRLHREQNITVVYITHFMEEAVAADRVIVMEQGKVVMEGVPKTIFSQVNRLKELGLDVPVAAEFAYRLRQLTMKIPEDIITDAELVVAVCP